MATMRECPVCGIRVKLENLEGHLKKVHPNAKVDAVLTENDKTDIKIAKKKEKKASQPFEARERRRWAIAGIIVVFVVVLVILAFTFLPRPEAALDPKNLIGEPAPELIGGNVKGGAQWNLNDHIGSKPVVVEFMATTCPWCVKFAPVMNDLYEFYGNGAEVEFVTVSVSSEDTVQDLSLFQDTHGSSWTHLKAAEHYGDDWRQHNTPLTFILDKNGIVREVLIGYNDFNVVSDSIDEYK